MDASIADLVQEVTVTSGTTQTLTLASVTGYGRFADAFANDETCYYVIRDGSNVELGIGTVKAGNTLDRAATPLVTVVAGVYDNTSPVRITLSGTEAIVACAASAKALDSIFNLSGYAQIADVAPTTGTTHTLNYALGDYQKITLPAAGTLTIATTNFVVGKTCSMLLELVNGGNCTITYPAAWKFAGGLAPTLTAAGTDTVMLVKDASEVFSLYVVGLNVVAPV